VDAAGIGQDVTMGRYLTPEAVRLGLFGLAGGCAAGLGWRVAGRTRWGAAPFVLAVLAATRLAGRTDWPRWDGLVAAGATVTLVAGAGAARLTTDPAVGWVWVAAGSLISAAGVWAGVPETGPALVAGGSVMGLAATALLTRAAWAPAASVGMAVVLGWAALSGAAGRPWAAVGGVLCTGVGPWFALRPVLPSVSWSRSPGLWLLVAHALLVATAARWIGVVPHAGWGRVAVVSAAGLAVALSARRQA
jgi:hypothetical protein